MTKIKTTLVVATMALAIAGCAKKRPAVLPPAPVDQNAGVVFLDDLHELVEFGDLALGTEHPIRDDQAAFRIAEP